MKGEKSGMKGLDLLWVAGGIALVYYLSQASPAAEAVPGGPPGLPVVPPGGPTLPGQKRRVLKQGMRGEEVKTLQKALNANKFIVTPDGIYGKLTMLAVQAFQRSRGLTADGIAGPKTLAALGI